MIRWLIVTPKWEYEIEWTEGSASIQRHIPVVRGMSFSGVWMDE